MNVIDFEIHVNEALDAQARHDLDESLLTIDWVVSLRFNDRRIHLIAVAFNADLTRSGMLLDAINRQGYTAQRCGGI
ncbi:MAG: hypothetical protein GZ085_02515 [Sulfuriferula multivorans]|uniref:Uncharacterized protein n=1 Tax=Sulfuriferula multivorans TaxID=1559896 RepID=A0A7C9NRY7_9PROT|nr:hypothetical protein [Sulfuriferula multivorans]